MITYKELVECAESITKQMAESKTQNVFPETDFGTPAYLKLIIAKTGNNLDSKITLKIRNGKLIGVEIIQDTEIEYARRKPFTMTYTFLLPNNDGGTKAVKQRLEWMYKIIAKMKTKQVDMTEETLMEFLG